MQALRDFFGCISQKTYKEQEMNRKIAADQQLED